MMIMHQFDEYQMHENLGEANENFVMKYSGRSTDSGLNSSMTALSTQLSTVNEEPDNIHTDPSGLRIPQISISRGSLSSLGSNTGSTTSDDIEFQKREEERIQEMYKVLNIERRKSVAKTKADGVDIARDYVRRASTLHDITTPGGDKSRAESRANSRRGSIKPSSSGTLNPNDMIRRSQRRRSSIFIPPKNYTDRQPSIF